MIQLLLFKFSSISITDLYQHTHSLTSSASTSLLRVSDSTHVEVILSLHSSDNPIQATHYTSSVHPMQTRLKS